MLNCYINTNHFANDIGEVIRLFLPMEEIRYEPLPLDHMDTRIGVFSMLEEKTATAWVRFSNGQSGLWSDEPVVVGYDAIEQKRYQKRAVKRAVFMALSQAYPDRQFPWGCLTGIRPTKMVHDMLYTQSMDAIVDTMRDYYMVTPEKIDLMTMVVDQQKKMDAERKKNDFDLYVGIPFCRTRCIYCSFAAYEMGKKLALEKDVDQYVHTLVREIQENMLLVQDKGYAIRSIYIGGGTPTALSRHQLQTIIEAIQRSCRQNPIEFTVEAGRPDTIDTEKLQMLHDHGIERISINPQTIHDSTLQKIRRDHTYQQFLTAYALARKIGFSCINVDLIVGLPNENPDMMRQTMAEMRRLAPENLTIHTLAIKRSADLKRSMTNFEWPSAQEAEEMLKIGHSTAMDMGLIPYYMYRQKYMSGNLENIGYALPNKESLYNVDIMEEATNILALGAGGISKWLFPQGRIERQPNPKDIPTYNQKVDIMTKRREEMIPAIN